ncbi:hypothetical protein GMOD_00000688 [Pyrenophora seminiperda CCB06]|uniref:Uncharacterized protein n=1 Tax=Pyrenophora seminiperda CCB06 TaxID=1302712 RepID=A0A3M7M7Y1_9PLEO|nr:hypothetical protein GMOD_00000688 [Pyrenophora seminiperda CCB06]
MPAIRVRQLVGTTCMHSGPFPSLLSCSILWLVPLGKHHAPHRSCLGARYIDQRYMGHRDTVPCKMDGPMVLSIPVPDRYLTIPWSRLGVLGLPSFAPLSRKVWSARNLFWKTA